MKQILFIILALLFALNAQSQKSVEQLINEGIAYHEDKQYEKAIETYKEALKIEGKSPLIYYEMSLSYYASADYKNAVKYADKVFSKDGKYNLQAYLTKGSALDLMGRTKESIKLFQKAIKKEGEHYLLYYNLALNYYKIRDFKNAQETLLKGIAVNQDHDSSHLLLAHVENALNHKVQSLLASHYFLFLEPNTNRSVEAYELLMKNFGGNVSKDPDKPNTINIFLNPGDDDNPFSATDMMISLLAATRATEENKDKSDDEMFVENTDSFFKIVGELQENKEDTAGYDDYITFFYDLAKSEHLETYCKYITQIGNENSRKWLEEHPEKMEAFDQWLRSH